ncbi:MAG TPA: class I SAM-dependent methyltransferase [Usitatibacter sp.]|nr:class I SAM-dependent methyltransferase [Usitatibacter sp.]
MSASFRALARRAAARYPPRDRYARLFAYGKLTRDPVFEHILERGLVPRDSRLLDIGCGQGLLAALLAADGRHGRWRYRGIDLGARDVERARHAAGPAGDLVVGDIRSVPFGAADVAILLDVLHYVEPEAQSGVLRRVRESLEGGGTLVMRVADAGGGLRFRITTAIDLASARMRGHRVKGLHHVPLDQRLRELESHGFRVEAIPMSKGTPFANVLLVARYDPKDP